MGALRYRFPGHKYCGGIMPNKKGVAVALGILCGLSVGFPAQRARAQSDPNSAPNPYRTVENWAKLPEGRAWGQVISADVARDGKSIWVVERCGGTSCANSN